MASEKTKPIAKHGPAQNKAGNGAKHYLVEWEQTIPLEKSDSLLKAAKCFLANGYLNGRCLFSGPTVPANGSFLVARAGSLKELDNLLAEERYHQASVKRIKQITEFIALQHQPFLNEWFVGDQKQRA